MRAIAGYVLVIAGGYMLIWGLEQAGIVTKNVRQVPK